MPIDSYSFLMGMLSGVSVTCAIYLIVSLLMETK